jgi:hypothetical protein
MEFTIGTGIFMRYTKLMLVLLGLAATLCAADPFAVTWKMNPTKTKYKVGTAPKEQTVTITEAGSDLNVKVAVDRGRTEVRFRSTTLYPPPAE